MHRVWISEQTATLGSYSIDRIFFFTNKMERDYCAVRADSLYETDMFFFVED